MEIQDGNNSCNLWLKKLPRHKYSICCLSYLMSYCINRTVIKHFTIQFIRILFAFFHGNFLYLNCYPSIYCICIPRAKFKFDGPLNYTLYSLRHSLRNTIFTRFVLRHHNIERYLLKQILLKTISPI